MPPLPNIPKRRSWIDGESRLPTSFRQVFGEVVPRDQPQGNETTDVYLDRIRAVTEHLLAQHRHCMARSIKALAETRAALRLPFAASGLDAFAPVVAPQPLRVVVEPLSRSQWMVYFSAEMSTLSLGLSELKTMSMAERLHSIAPHVQPEFAAISMAAGLSGNLPH